MGNLSTENSAIAYEKYNYILISDIEVTEFSHNSILSVFQTNTVRICYLLHTENATATILINGLTSA